jgi:hypothetical protein
MSPIKFYTHTKQQAKFKSVYHAYVYTNMEERVRTSMPQVETTATIPVLERLKAEEKVCAYINDHEGQR